MTARLLMSFNVALPGAPLIGLLDPGTGLLSSVDLPDSIGRVDGIWGIALHNDLLCAIGTRRQWVTEETWGPVESFLLLLDDATLAVRAMYPLPDLEDPHSLLSHENGLLVVSTGTDEVVQLDLRGDELRGSQVVWRPAEANDRLDQLHLNSICRRGDQILVSGFGYHTPDRPRGARDGFIVDMLSGEYVVRGLQQPHSVTVLGDQLVWCTSRQRIVQTLDGRESAPLPGYTRGLGVIGDRLYVGTSCSRTFSRSTGKRGAPRDPGACTLNVLATDTLDLIETIDMSVVGTEIYELLAVPEIAGWATLDPVAWRDRALRAARAGMQVERDRKIDWLITELENRDAIITERDEAIVWLQGELTTRSGDTAAKDQMIEWLRNELKDRERTIVDRDLTIGWLRDELEASEENANRHAAELRRRREASPQCQAH